MTVVHMKPKEIKETYRYDLLYQIRDYGTKHFCAVASHDARIMMKDVVADNANQANEMCCDFFMKTYPGICFNLIEIEEHKDVTVLIDHPLDAGAVYENEK